MNLIILLILVSTVTVTIATPGRHSVREHSRLRRISVSREPPYPPSIHTSEENDMKKNVQPAKSPTVPTPVVEGVQKLPPPTPSKFERQLRGAINKLVILLGIPIVVVLIIVSFFRAQKWYADHNLRRDIRQIFLQAQNQQQVRFIRNSVNEENPSSYYSETKDEEVIQIIN
ncbi:Protein CBG27672 [Caenorhabditis briggsae]|uniref:Protein CBG27672 n=2 Tax=Caenorhabditis briggsae TaxID=6238 RepID=B6IJB7_CAEBR|nr:Protein CBG27672 [Caenorhabditis briggsae]ULT82067.1 hypothetical protein L3Y34_011789 [Caenorhabditis briggsae]CAR99951.1 Protein CBG27672 [Caenorhabditis briggsae]